jgi:formiminotetrahydrofolate cyclodeaminase
MKAYKQAKTSDEKAAQAAIDVALKQATAVPLGVAERAKEVAQFAESLAPITSPNMKSDLTTAAALARAAITAALANVEINLVSLKDEAFAAEARKRAEAVRTA